MKSTGQDVTRRYLDDNLTNLANIYRATSTFMWLKLQQQFMSEMFLSVGQSSSESSRAVLGRAAAQASLGIPTIPEPANQRVLITRENHSLRSGPHEVMRHGIRWMMSKSRARRAAIRGVRMTKPAPLNSLLSGKLAMVSILKFRQTGFHLLVQKARGRRDK